MSAWVDVTKRRILTRRSKMDNPLTKESILAAVRRLSDEPLPPVIVLSRPWHEWAISRFGMLPPECVVEERCEVENENPEKQDG